MFILITLYNVVPSKEDTEASEDEDVDEQQEPEPAVPSTNFAQPRGPGGRSTYLKLAS